MKCCICNKILILLIVFFNATLSLKAQPVHISGSIDSNDLNQINIYQLGIKTDGEPNKKYSVGVKPDGTFSYVIKNIEAAMYRIGDAFVGHKIFISPGDVVKIQLKKIAKPSYEIFHRMNVETRYPMNYMFFDSILPFFGHKKLEFSKTNFDGKTYKEQCIKRYKKATDLLADFYYKKQISDSFFKYAQIELETNYFRWLVFPFAKYKLDPKSVDPSYFKELDTFAFGDINAVEKTQYYLEVAREYNNNALNTLNTNDPSSWLYSSFRTAASHFKGFARDQLMAWKIDEIIRFNSKDSGAFKEVLSSFFQECKTPYLRNEITAKTGERAQKLRDAPALFQKLMNKSFFSDVKGNGFSMITLPVKKDWLLIDCWASWCKPCKEQEPFFESFRQQYQDRIAFLNLSLDKEKTAWEDDIKKYDKNPAINYFLTEGDEKAFTYFFEISTIPRFILIDLKNRKVVNDNMPFPEHKEQFEQVVNEVLYRK